MADVKVTVKADLIDKEARAKFEAFEKQVNAKALISTLKLDTEGALKNFNDFVKSVQGTTVKVKLETDAVSTQGGANPPQGGQGASKKRAGRKGSGSGDSTRVRSLASARQLDQTRVKIRYENTKDTARKNGVGLAALGRAMSAYTNAQKAAGEADSISAQQARSLTNARNTLAAETLKVADATKKEQEVRKKSTLSSSAISRERQYSKDLRKIEGLKAQITSPSKELKGKIKQTETDYRKALNQAKGVERLSLQQATGIDTARENVASLVSELREAIRLQNDVGKSATKDSLASTRKLQQDRLLAKVEEAKRGLEDEELKGKLDTAKNDVTTAFDVLGDGDKVSTAAMDEYINKCNALKGELDKVAAAKKKSAKADSDGASKLREEARLQNMQIQAQKRLADMRAKESQWSKMMTNSDAAAEYRSLMAQFESYASGNGTVEGFKKLNAQSRAFEANMKAAGLATKSWGDSFKQAAGFLGTFFSAQRIFSMLQNATATIKQNVTEINTAMTDLRKVTDATEGRYDRYLESASNRAAELSASIDGYIAGTTGFARAGYSMTDAQELGEWANVYYNVGDGVASVDDATGSLIATMKAFKKGAADAGHVVDTFNKLGNNYAIESGNIGTIMEGSASALSAAGASFEETAAMGTAMFEINRNASKTASTLKTVSLRMRGAKAELINMGEDTDGMAESTSKLRDQILALTNIDGTGGFDILTETGDFKDFYDMMDGIAKKWVQMDKSSTNAAALLELISGKVRASDVSALLSNFGTAREALFDATNSEGSAMEEYSKWQNSIEAKQKKINAQTQKLSISLVDDGTLASAYDIFSGILSVVTSITDALGGWTSIITALSPVLLKTFPQLGTAYVQHAPLREIPAAA